MIHKEAWYREATEKDLLRRFRNLFIHPWDKEGLNHLLYVELPRVGGPDALEAMRETLRDAVEEEMDRREKDMEWLRQMLFQVGTHTSYDSGLRWFLYRKGLPPPTDKGSSCKKAQFEENLRRLGESFVRNPSLDTLMALWREGQRSEAPWHVYLDRVDLSKITEPMIPGWRYTDREDPYGYGNTVSHGAWKEPVPLGKVLQVLRPGPSYDVRVGKYDFRSSGISGFAVLRYYDEEGGRGYSGYILEEIPEAIQELIAELAAEYE